MEQAIEDGSDLMQLIATIQSPEEQVLDELICGVLADHSCQRARDIECHRGE
jgi:hypothetical protein